MTRIEAENQAANKNSAKDKPRSISYVAKHDNANGGWYVAKYKGRAEIGYGWRA